MMEIDKKIADLVLDDENLAKAHVEIEASASVLGDFSDKTQIYSYHIDAGVVTPNEVREKIGLDDIEGGDTLIEPKEESAPSDIGSF
jgi:phage portal protein BeeE